MISQADIIRTLVNQNCTDESILSTALSPDCTPPKLLEKFTEAERFDLALDVSMKLGWDVLPLWKTWAMRCLKNHNFQGAREKFKHCFQKIRSPNGRGNLLGDILKVLVRMDENEPSLSEEIESIKQRRGSLVSGDSDIANLIDEPRQHAAINVTKPKIYDECMHYLRKYGNVEQSIKFFVGNHLWEHAINLLINHKDRISAQGYFISNVVSYSLTTGHLDDLVAAFKQKDKYMERSQEYFAAIYEYYADKKHYNTLYFIQDAIGDHVAAAKNQIRNFFLKRPTVSYKELNQRLASLINARHNYEQHLVKLQQRAHQSLASKVERLPSPVKLFTWLSEDETKRRLQTIDTQIDITRNFAINEVSGCRHGVEVVTSKEDEAPSGNVSDDDDVSPVTLFQRSEKNRTLLTALVLIYYDSDCKTYFSESGLKLANRLIDESKLDKLQVFKTAMRIILDDESTDIVENANLLLKKLHDDYLACTKRTKSKPTTRTPQVPLNDNNAVIAQPISTARDGRKSTTDSTSRLQQKRASYAFVPREKDVQPGTTRAARLLCDDVIRDVIRICREPDYKMELSKLLSPEARIELNIELGKLSIAQRLAFDMNRPDYVVMVLKEADRLNQDHVKDVCQHWLAKH